MRPTLHSQMLDHLQKPLCPRFSKYDRQKLLLLEPNECTPLQSQHPDFSADICFSQYQCNEGLVRVRRKDRALCKQANLKYPISGNATHDAFHRQFSGPDSFYVVFSGSEKLSPPDWYHAGQCLYVFPFHISNPGKLSLDITHLYDSFGAVVEQADEWPILKNQQIITDVQLEICRGCPSRVAEPRFSLPNDQPLNTILQDGSSSHGGSHDQPYELDSTLSTKRGKDVSLLPPCSRDIAVQGAWLPAHPLDKQSWRRSNYTWTPLSCTFGRPLDSSCLARRKNALKILFQGDTHLRVALESLLRRLNGTNTRQTSTMTSDDRLHRTFGTTTLTYIHDPLISHMGEQSDVLVANMGHWATGTRFLDQLWSTTKYHDRLRDVIDVIQQRARDLQDLEDEDFDTKNEVVDEDNGGEAEYDGGHDDEEEDEEELEFERENLRQKKLKEKETEELQVFWDDETGDAEVGSQAKPHPTPEEQERQEELDYLTDKYRVEDRLRAEDESYRTGGRRHKDAMEGARPRYPHHRILRQSKHLVSLDGSPEKQEPGKELGDDTAAENSVSSGDDSRPAKSTSNDTPKDRVRTSGQDGNNEVSGGRGPNGKKSTHFQSGRSASKDNLIQQGSSRARRPRRPLYRNYIYNHPREGPVGSSSVRENPLIRRFHEDRDLDLHSQSSPLKIAWFGMVAYPETQAAGVHLIHDWRTIYRLRYWNQIAEDVMLLHGVRFMDFFSMTLSMLDTSPDRAHYFGTDASEAMLEELSYKLGLCDDDGDEQDS
ncbi:hypothetical protein BGZ72_005313 [Mortierella alpina]|nr:hypothetical protein BGZ72_005313 [Mortierella alpina]